ncbi:MAG: hypothetical protein ABI142_00680 [Bryocella sp.]
MLSTSALTQQAHAQLVYTRRGEWDAAGFEKLTHVSARTKQVFDVRDIGAGKFLSNVKNSLNAFHYGFGIPNDQIKIAVALHGASNTLSFDDAMWKKYRLGEFVNLTDPVTGKPAVRNLYVQKASGRSANIDDRKSEFQDASIQALQSRNVQFLSCHTATEEQAEAITKKFGLTAPVEETAKDLQAHVLPGVLIVPGMTAAVSLLQSEGHYTYITV